MRSGDFAVDVIPSGYERVRELDTGHVLARPGAVYRLRLRNFGPLHCVVDVEIDGRRVTAGGLVLRPWSTTDLERPVDDGEDGCFTVAAEGDETAFGPDGGRDNDALGLIDARFRRELPGHRRPPEMPPVIARTNRSMLRDEIQLNYPPSFEALLSPSRMAPPPGVFYDAPAIERAAGTGLTGHSDQRFDPVTLGPLEREATLIQLRLVIGSEAAIADGPAHPAGERVAPPRPAALP